MATPIEIAQRLLTHVGGKDNVLSATACMTRLRLKLAHTDQLTLSSPPTESWLLGYQLQGEEHQFILGPGKAEAVLSAFKTLLKPSEDATASASVSQNVPNLARFANVLGLALRPALPAILFFLASALLARVMQGITMTGAWYPTGLLKLLIASTVAAIPLLIGLGAGQALQANPLLCALACTSLLNTPLHWVLRLPLIAIACWLIGKIEAKLSRFLTGPAALLLLPLTTITLTLGIALLVVAPIFEWSLETILNAYSLGSS